MSDETKQVEVLFGPHAGHFVNMSVADAARAVAEKWALDPPRTPPIDPNAAPLPDLSPDEREAAEKAAAKWSAGDTEPDVPEENEERAVAPSSTRRGYRTK